MGDTTDHMPVTITVTEEARADIEALAQRLAAAGLAEATALPSIGLISGTAAPDGLAALRAQSGVQAVEMASGMHIPPPDADIQ